MAGKENQQRSVTKTRIKENNTEWDQGQLESNILGWYKERQLIGKGAGGEAFTGGGDVCEEAPDIHVAFISEIGIQSKISIEKITLGPEKDIVVVRSHIE